jgi:hypothetical protein
MTIRGTFTRVSPAEFAEKIGIAPGWFVISHRWMGEKKARRLQHGKWFKIAGTEDSVYRVLRFSANLSGILGKPGQIVIDYSAWLDLFGRTENVDGPLELQISAARWWEAPRLATSHPDPSIRLAGWIAVLSFALGIISLVLGAWSQPVTSMSSAKASRLVRSTTSRLLIVAQTRASCTLPRSNVTITDCPVTS